MALEQMSETQIHVTSNTTKANGTDHALRQYIYTRSKKVTAFKDQRGDNAQDTEITGMHPSPCTLQRLHIHFDITTKLPQFEIILQQVQQLTHMVLQFDPSQYDDVSVALSIAHLPDTLGTHYLPHLKHLHLLETPSAGFECAQSLIALADDVMMGLRGLETVLLEPLYMEYQEISDLFKYFVTRTTCFIIQNHRNDNVAEVLAIEFP